MGNPVVHFEIVGSDGPALEKFYAEVFGWHVQSMPEMSYGLVDTHASGAGINGGIGTSQEPGKQYVTVYVEAPDIQAMLDTAVSLGGTVVQPVMEIPGVVTLAFFADPAGNGVGLVQGTGAPEEQMPPSKGDGAPVEWFEIMGPDGHALRKFYGDLFGWTFTVDPGFDYGEVDTAAGRGIAGGVGTHPQGTAATTVYAKVDDLAEYLKRAENLGGKTIMESMSVGDNTTIALFSDPQGNLFGLYTR